jgi:molybdopterin-guanine dinucleotide biosynthesis protein
VVGREPVTGGPWLGAVLAGGRSRRFGRPKATAPFLGQPLALRPARVLDAVCRDVVVVGRREELPPRFPFRVVPDRVPDAGPLGGLHAALAEAAAAGDEGVVLLGCDMPLVTPGLVRQVALEGVRSGRAAAAPALGPREVEPLCGWYGTASLPLAERRLGGEDRSLLGFLEESGAHRIPRDRLGATADLDLALRSVNTPAELERLEALAVEALRDGRWGPVREAVPPVVCVVGFKNSGKTGVAVGLVAELRRRGHRVAAWKHGHHFRLDTEGTDSWRLRHEGGGDPVLLAGPEGFVVTGGWGERGEPGLEALLRRYRPRADVVVAEGFKRSGAPRIEVHRGGPEADRVHDPEDPRLVAVVTDAPSPPRPVPEIFADDPSLHERLADLVEERIVHPRDPGAER